MPQELNIEEIKNAIRNEIKSQLDPLIATFPTVEKLAQERLRQPEIPLGEKPQEHLMREYEMSCPDCGMPNEHYVAPKWKCKNCHAPVGVDPAKVSKCPYCNGNVAVPIDAS